MLAVVGTYVVVVPCFSKPHYFIIGTAAYTQIHTFRYSSCVVLIFWIVRILHSIPVVTELVHKSAIRDKLVLSFIIEAA